MNLHAAKAAKPGTAALEPRARDGAAFSLSIMHDLDAARDAWLAFEDKAAPTPFQTYHWMRAWQTAIGDKGGVSPLIVLGHRGGRLAFILPFAVERRWGARRLAWFGQNYADYNGPLIDPALLPALPADFAARTIEQVLKEAPRIDYCYLAKQPQSLFGFANPFAGFHSVDFTCRAHHAQLSHSWEDFSLSHRSSRSLRRLREKERKLATLGDVTFEQVTAPDERMRLMDLLLGWKIEQLTARGDPVPFADPAAQRLMRETVSAAPDDPRFRLYALKCGGRPIALAFCLVGHGQLIYYLCVYQADETARHSPGLLLLIHVFKAAIAEGLEIFDFSNGDEDYKSHWIDRSERISVSILAWTWKGRIAASLDRARLEAVRWVKQNPPARALAGRLLRLRYRLSQSEIR